jgi:hypothetical protein
MSGGFMKSKILVLLLSTLTFNFAFANGEEVIAAKEQVNSACTADAQTAGCAGEKVGYGLLKCLHEYKKTHKDFKFSEGCKTSMKTLKTEKTEAKAEKAAQKSENK